MARYQVEYNNASVKETFVFLLLVKSHRYDVPSQPPNDQESIIVDTDAKTVTFHRSEQRDAIKVSPTDRQLIAAARAGMAILKAEQLLGGGGSELVEQLRTLVGNKQTSKKRYRTEDCEAAEHVQRDYVFDGRKVRMQTCMACARAAADGDDEALAMFMSSPISVRAFIKDFVDMHDARKATKQ